MLTGVWNSGQNPKEVPPEILLRLQSNATSPISWKVIVVGPPGGGLLYSFFCDYRHILQTTKPVGSPPTAAYVCLSTRPRQRSIDSKLWQSGAATSRNSRTSARSRGPYPRTRQGWLGGSRQSARTAISQARSRSHLSTQSWKLSPR